MRSMARSSGAGLGAGLIVVAMFIFAVVVGGLYMTSGKDVVCTVTDMDRTTKVVDGQSSTDIRVWTEECGVLSMNDSLVGLSFDTADKYGMLKKGQKYEFHTFGWRIPVLSQFPNITEVRPA